MPVGKVFDAREGQILTQPVSNYYQGKALRLNQALGEKELEQADAKLDLEERRVAVAEDQVAAARKQFEQDVGIETAKGYAQDLYSRIFAIDEAVTAGEVDEGGALDVAAQSFADYASTLPEKYAAPIIEKLSDGLSIDEYRQIKASNAGALGDYGLLDEAGTPTTHQKHLGELLKSGAITKEQHDQLLLDIERKAGTITGTTEFDPASGVNASGVSRNTIEFQDSVIGAVGAIQTGTELLDIAFTNPESLGVPGGFMRFGTNLVSGAKAIADWGGYEPLDEEDTEMQDAGYGAFDYGSIDTDKLGVSGAEAERFRAGVYGIAFAAAVAEQGTRPTDKDIQQFIDQIGGRATSAKSFGETIVQFMRRQDRRLKTIADVKQIGEADRKAAFEAWTPAYRRFMETYAKTSGKQTATHADTGEKRIEMSPGVWEEY